MLEASAAMQRASEFLFFGGGRKAIEALGFRGHPPSLSEPKP